MALACVLVLTPAVGLLAERLGVVATPRQDRWHQKPTPMLGGVAIFIATVLAVLFFSRPTPALVSVLAGGTLVFIAGLIDDLVHLRPYWKLLAQIAAACALLVGGVVLNVLPERLVAIPVTIFWLVGITNAFNLLDNMDGLSAGVAGVAALVLFVYFVQHAEQQLAVVSISLVAATAGFLVYNSNPARIFMGDAGSMFLGFTLGAVAISGPRERASDLFLTLLVPTAVLGLPIFDTSMVTIMRALHGRSIAEGGKDHLSHRLVALGLSERGAVTVLYGISAAFGTLGLISGYVGLWTSMALGTLMVVAVVLFGAFLAQVRVYSEEEYRRLAPTSPRATFGGPGLLMYKRQVAEVLLDLVLVWLSYLGAYVLKFEGNLQGEFLHQFIVSLPYLLVAKMLTFFALGTYQPIWRYVGIADVVTIFKASSVGSLLSVVVIALFLGFEQYSRSVFVIDWLLLTTLMVGARMSYRILGEWFASVRRREGAKVLVVGAGDVGEMVVRNILRDRHGLYQPAGFLDDDLRKRRRSIHGYPVLGSVEDIEGVVRAIAPDRIVLALPQEAEEQRRVVVDFCRDRSLPLDEASDFLGGRLTAGAREAGDGADHPKEDPT